MDPFLELATLALDTAESPGGVRARVIVDSIVARMQASGDNRWVVASRHQRRELLMHALCGMGSVVADLADACPRYPQYLEYLVDEIRRSDSLNPALDLARLRRELLSNPARMMEVAREIGAAAPFSFVLSGELEEIADLRSRRHVADPESWLNDLRGQRVIIETKLARLRDFVGTSDLDSAWKSGVVRQITGLTRELVQVENKIAEVNKVRDLWYQLLSVEDRILELDCDSGDQPERYAESDPRDLLMEIDRALTRIADPNTLEAEVINLSRPLCAQAAAVRVKLEEQTTRARDGNAPPVRSRESQPEGPAGNSPYARALNSQLLGLAFSGGGIRSATFNLGILQGLADLGLLTHIDYLSTVSGGGYIAAWLLGWCRRLTGGIRSVEARLSPRQMPQPDIPGRRPIRFLREYSNYLTPKTGFFSADTWTMISVWFRNTLLNQLVLVVALAALLMVPRIGFVIIQGVMAASPDGWWLFNGALVFLTVSVVLIGLNLWSFDPMWRQNIDCPSTGGRVRRFLTQLATRVTQQGSVQLGIVIPVLLASAFAAILLRWWTVQAPPLAVGDTYVPQPLEWWASLWAHTISATPEERARWTAAGLTSGVIFVGFCVMSALGRIGRSFFTTGKDLTLPQSVLVALAIGTINGISAIAGGLLMIPVCLIVQSWRPESAMWHALIFGTPLLVAVFGLTAILQTGLMGRNFPDERREWWSRLGAWLIIYGSVWTLLGVLAIYSPLVIANLHAWIVGGAAGAWVTATISGVLAGRSTSTEAKTKSKSLLKEVVATIAPWLFITGYLVLLSMLLHVLIIKLWFLPEPNLEMLRQQHWTLLSVPAGTIPTVVQLALGLVVLAILLGWRIDVNEFSMHHFYKNRLMRCYLGASRGRRRRPNRFTGFDTRDDLKLATLSKLAPPNPGDPRRTLRPFTGPFPIVNTALNVVAGDDLAWQERKAESFVFTPLYSGFEYRSAETERSRHGYLAGVGFRPTRVYGYRHAGGIGMGTAVAISGAAANPNMGYHSSPATSFLMTMFNVRLGWWLGNPRHRDGYGRASPGIGLLYLIAELMGSTTNRSKYVNLSDGGHFENLGIYELVRRRCMFIIACDGEQDSSLTFNGLANAIRKCRVDFGINIEINLDQIRQVAENASSTAHCVVGTIDYGNDVCGRLLYIKSSLSSDEPSDVQEYAKREPAFPHQTTGDQWFDESQFESYRALGQHVAHATFGRAAANPSRILDKCAFFEYLSALWWPPTPDIKANASARSEELSQLFERSRQAQSLATLDHLAFRTRPEKRDEYYYINALIEHMEHTFTDLNLERDLDHPQNQPWIGRFREWASDPVFRAVWDNTKHTYSERFRRFCEDEFGLS